MNLNTNTQKLTALSGNISKLNFAYENWNAITEKYFFWELEYMKIKCEFSKIKSSQCEYISIKLIECEVEYWKIIAQILKFNANILTFNLENQN